jgi:hypothetical protein
LLQDAAFLDSDCTTLVEVIMDRLDAPRLLADGVAINKRAARAATGKVDDD